VIHSFRHGGRRPAIHVGCQKRRGWRACARHDVLLLLLLLLAFPAFAVEPAERLPDPGMEARARAISTELRCLVCQNESIDESHADLAHDIRVLVRERLKAGDTDAQATQAVVSRYGDFVLLRPPVKPATWLLWFGPVALLLAGLAGTVFWLRRRPAVLPPALSAVEQAELERLLKDDA
jgi:cytochrome c-type biogenesis protein CcmH